MAFTIEAVYEGGVLKPVEPLSSLQEGQKVEVTIVAKHEGWAERTAGMMDWKGRHEEIRAFLDDKEELYGGPEDWFRNYPGGAEAFRLKLPEEKP